MYKNGILDHWRHNPWKNVNQPSSAHAYSFDFSPPQKIFLDSTKYTTIHNTHIISYDHAESLRAAAKCRVFLRSLNYIVIGVTTYIYGQVKW